MGLSNEDMIADLRLKIMNIVMEQKKETGITTGDAVTAVVMCGAIAAAAAMDDKAKSHEVVLDWCLKLFQQTFSKAMKAQLIANKMDPSMVERSKRSARDPWYLRYAPIRLKRFVRAKRRFKAIERLGKYFQQEAAKQRSSLN